MASASQYRKLGRARKSGPATAAGTDPLAEGSYERSKKVSMVLWANGRRTMGNAFFSEFGRTKGHLLRNAGRLCTNRRDRWSL